MTKRLTPEEREAREAAREAKRLQTRIEAAEASAAELRPLRNDAILRAMKTMKATKLAEETGISHAFISRIVRDKGKPKSGWAQDRDREEAK